MAKQSEAELVQNRKKKKKKTKKAKSRKNLDSAASKKKLLNKAASKKAVKGSGSKKGGKRSSSANTKSGAKEKPFDVHSAGSLKDGLQLVLKGVKDSKCPYKKKVEMMQSAESVVEDEKTDDATVKWFAAEFRKCFGAEV